MAKEILVIPEDHLAEVIAILRAGLQASPSVTPVVRALLEQWCEDEEAYLADDTQPPEEGEGMTVRT